MEKLDIYTAVVLWTPISVGLLAAYLLAVIALAVLLFVNRVAVGTWFNARLQETSTKHAFNVALTTTSSWLFDLAGMLPAGDHMPFKLVEFGWLVALALFIKPDASANPT